MKNLTDEILMIVISYINDNLLTIINLAEVNKNLYNLIRKSDTGKEIWKNYCLCDKDETIFSFFSDFNKLTNEEIFKELAKIKFNKLSMLPYNAYHETRLNNLYEKRDKIEKEIKSLEYRKRISMLKLNKVFKKWVNDEQIRNYISFKNQNSEWTKTYKSNWFYIPHKNQNLKINNEAEFSESSEED